MSDLFDRVAAKVGLAREVPVLRPSRAPVWRGDVGGGQTRLDVAETQADLQGPEWRSPSWAAENPSVAARSETEVRVEREVLGPAEPGRDVVVERDVVTPPSPKVLSPKRTDAPNKVVPVLDEAPSRRVEGPGREALVNQGKAAPMRRERVAEPLTPVRPVPRGERVEVREDGQERPARELPGAPEILAPKVKERATHAPGRDVPKVAPTRPTVSIGQIRVVAPPALPVQAPTPEPVVMPQAAPAAAAPPAGQALKTYLGWRR